MMHGIEGVVFILLLFCFLILFVRDSPVQTKLVHRRAQVQQVHILRLWDCRGLRTLHFVS